jgi:NSS family neurotransmitter:Na+ symporter
MCLPVVIARCGVDVARWVCIMGSMEERLPERERWRTRAGFVLAAIGSAAGLGNIWRFSYVAGEHGGAVFILLYMLCVLFVGLPIVIAETAIGRRTQRDAVAAFKTLAPGFPWMVTGVLATFTASVVLAFYSVIAGWTLKFFVSAMTGGLWRVEPSAFGAHFDAFIRDPWQPLLWQGLMMAATVFVIARGVRGGIERCNRILIPLLGVIVVALALFSVTLDGAERGLAFLFDPDWSVLRRPDVYLAAMGQAFFSLGVGAAVYVTYGSYLVREQSVAAPAVTIVAGDTLIALIAGLAIFPAVFAFGLDPAEGPALAFITLPGLFRSMAGGAAVGAVFFFLLVAAALTSMLSMLEVPVSWLAARPGWSRLKASIAVGATIYLLGMPAALGFGPLRDVRVAGRGILDLMDYAASNIALPLGGLLIALFVGWSWGRGEALAAAFGGSRLGVIWLWLLRLVAPAAIVLIFLRAVEIL